MEARKYWKNIHEQRALTKRIKEALCTTQKNEMRKLFLRLEDLQQDLVNDFRDAEGY